MKYKDLVEMVAIAGHPNAFEKSSGAYYGEDQRARDYAREMAKRVIAALKLAGECHYD